MYYAIRNKKTKRFVVGTDRRYPHPHQRTCDNVYPPLLFTDIDIAQALRHRQVSAKNYEVVEVTLEVTAAHSITPEYIKELEELRDTALML